MIASTRRWVVAWLLAMAAAEPHGRTEETRPDDPERILSESPAADLILTNGKIVTVDRAFSIAQAMAIRGDRIIAVGRDEEVLARRGPETRVVDLAGACVLPGLIDSHCHPSAAAVAEIDHPRPPMDSIADVLAYIEGRAKVLPKSEWIHIRQRFITRFRERRYPTRAELDRVAPDHPVIFQTGPDCCVNSAALRAAGIGRDYVPPSKDAKAERDPATGELTGVFRNMTGVFSRHVREIPISREERLASLRRLLSAYNAAGLTSAGDRDAGPQDVEAYEALRARGELTVRISIAHHLDLGGGREALDQQLERIASLRAAREPDLWIRVRTVKGYVDGGMLTGSAFMREPWGTSEIYNIADPAYRGIRFVSEEALRLAVQRARAHGFAFTAHAQGDGGSEALISAYEALDREAPIHDCRMCVSHGSFQGLDLIRRAVKIGVVVDSQPAWLYLDASVLLEQFGRKRMRYFIPLRSWFEEGGIVAGGSDHMIGFDPDRSINPFNPFLGIWVAITRRARWVDQPVIPEEALTREQALRLYTVNGAILEFAEEEKGSLEPGKLADFIVIDRDYLACPVDEIRSIRVLRTYVGGKLVYERPARASVTAPRLPGGS